MADSQFKLLHHRRFLPLFLTQFLGAFNDNLFKTALTILITYRIAEQAGVNAQVLVTFSFVVFILPFFLFSATAGQLADKWEKASLVRIIKLVEIVIMLLAGVGFAIGELWLLLIILFLMGTQSTFFGPLKYAILPDHLKPDELIAGNGLIEAGTFLAILFGMIVGGPLILLKNGIHIMTFAVVTVALLGWWSSRFIPKAGPQSPNLKISLNPFTETWRILVYTKQNRNVFLAILGISWFWLVGATFISQFPIFAKDVLHGDENVATLFLTVFSFGIGVGSLLCNRLLRGRIHATYVPIAALGITVFAIDLYFASCQGVASTTELISTTVFLSTNSNLRILFDLLLISICGGVYIVPLYAIMQSRSDVSHRSRIIAGNNVLNSLFMVVAGLATMLMLAAKFSVPQVFLTVAVINAVVAIYICKLLPDAIIRSIFQGLFRLIYRAEVRGLEHFHAAGERVVIVVNHVSFLDGALLATYLPDKPIFAVNTHMAKQRWVTPFLSLVEAFPLDPTNPLMVKALTKEVRKGKKCVIFPEGRITVTGALMKIYEGPGMIADKADAQLLPIRIDGAQYTHFSRLRGKVRFRWFPKITITILPPRNFNLAPELKGRERRAQVSFSLYDTLTEMMFMTCNQDMTLFRALLNARTTHGGKHLVIEDVQRQPLSYDKLITASFALSQVIRRESKPSEIMGLLLPNSTATVITLFAMQACDRIPAMINFSSGLNNMQVACRSAGIKTVITSRQFVTTAKLTQIIAQLTENITILYLEDLTKHINWWHKLVALLSTQWFTVQHRKQRAEPDDTAIVLFTSGSEGVPKGVALSHRNILSNCYQLSARVDYGPTDIVFNSLPVFHSFGLTGGLLLPVFGGIRSFLYPSPLHYRIVPELVYDSNATMLFGTDTFLRGYALAAHPYDFYSVRYVFAGAEKVAEQTRRLWMEKFGLRIFEGYGTTETSPALASNTPMQFKAGTVGRFLPGIKYRLEPVPGIANGGRLFVCGPNIMLGYLRTENPGKLIPLQHGWYDTGDIVEVDDHGYITIIGRCKRFAKIAGEMVSLTAVENHASTLWPDFSHAVVALPDVKKGEQLALVTDCPDGTREAFLAYSRTNGIPELMAPRNVVVVATIPVLGSGKTDYQAVTHLVQQTDQTAT